MRRSQIHLEIREARPTHTRDARISLDKYDKTDILGKQQKKEPQMRLTKNDMARVIVQALYNMPVVPAVDHPEVVNRARRGTMASLTKHHEMACKALNSVKELVLPVDAPAPGVGWQIDTGNQYNNRWVRN
jgi:hypothetical protein